MLEVKNISFGYSKKLILKDVSLSLEKSEIVGLMAPSGYGKTTLAKIMSGYLNSGSGEILIDGEDIKNLKRGFSKVQLIHQHPQKSVNPNWKVKKILNEAWRVNEDVKKKFGIRDEWLKKFPQELSGGELMRICIARAMDERTEYLIADEITAMLDAITQVQLIEVIEHFAREHHVGVMLISHNKKLLERAADRILYLDEINKAGTF